MVTTIDPPATTLPRLALVLVGLGLAMGCSTSDEAATTPDGGGAGSTEAGSDQGSAGTNATADVGVDTAVSPADVSADTAVTSDGTDAAVDAREGGAPEDVLVNTANDGPDSGDLDQDGDGWTPNQGDCCDSTSKCATPALVNPGAFEVAANGLDDDCDGNVDNQAIDCNMGLASDASSALDYAKAIDLCATTVETPPNLQQKRWGVIGAAFLLADGTGVPAAAAHSIRTGFGTAVTPRKGAALAVLSTGAAADTNDVNPSFAAFQVGKSNATSSGAPFDWFTTNGNTFPIAPGCPAPVDVATVYDPIMLKLRVRVPTNAKSFSVSTYFFSAEFPEWVCSTYNDVFLTLLDSAFAGVGPAANPGNKNLAFFKTGLQLYPVGASLAVGNTGLFKQCINGAVGCFGTAGTVTSCTGTAELAGTGFDTADTACASSTTIGGGTSWLTTTGNVKPGETIELRFVLWDTGDHLTDSLVLLDNFTWSLNEAVPGTHL